MLLAVIKVVIGSLVGFVGAELPTVLLDQVVLGFAQVLLGVVELLLSALLGVSP